MKACICSFCSCLFLTLLAAFAVRPAAAQVIGAFPAVTISATDSHASEAGPDPGTFTVMRRLPMDTPPPNTSLTVFYRIGGTASNGVDYQTLSGSVTIPPLALGATITVAPIDDALAEGDETVVVQLTPSPLACPSCGYNIGWPSNAVVVIADNDTPATNHPPFVQLNAPQNGDVFPAPANIALRAYADDTEDGNNLTVEFFEGTNSLGLGVFVPTLCPSPFCPFFALVWSNVPPGSYTLTAKATDSAGASSVSAAAHVTVSGSNPPPVVNIVARDPLASEGTNFWQGYPGVIWPNATWDAWHVNVGGTNTATFVVGRHGSTNDDLAVHYEIGGTASNGVDYVALSGAATIPAGRHSAQIVVVPIDDALPEWIETVVLRLRPSPDYTVGFPAQATALIIDNDRPRPPCAVLPDHQFHFCRPATNGFCFRIEVSTDLINWTPVCTNVVTDGALHFVDPDAPPLNARFYRARPELGLAPDE